MSVDKASPQFYDGIAEDAVLENLGYQQGEHDFMRLLFQLLIEVQS